MRAEQDPSFPTLSQFLDLERRWLGIADRSQLAHRICHTIVILLDTAAAAIGMESSDGTYQLLSSAGDWGAISAADGIMAPELTKRARSSRIPQLKNVRDATVGIFPFRAQGSALGCLHVRVPRPVLRGTEVAFLRFLSSLAGIVLSGREWTHAEPVDATSVETRVGDDTASRLVAMAVHDLRNPLSVLAGYASVLADETLGPLTVDQRDAVRAINRQVHVITGVIDELIELARLGGTGNTPVPTRFDLGALFRELRETRFTHADDRILWPGAEATFELTTDRQRVFSIVQNLVDNAVKHGRDGSIGVDCTRNRGQLIVKVADRGPGLAPEARAVLLNHTGEPTVPRSGLGLYMIARYVRSLGGKVIVRDRIDGGTEIEVHIPSLVRNQP